MTEHPPLRTGATRTRPTAPAGGLKARPLRYKIGLALLILYPFLYLALPIAPVLPLEAGAQVAFAGGAVAVAEAVLLLAIALMGKEAYQAVKARLRVRGRRTEAR